MVFTKTKPPWEMSRKEKEEYEHSGYEKQQKILDEVLRRKDQWAKTGKWANWERGRKKALAERRDYFREHPEKKDDFSGV